AREAARRASCSNNLKNLGLAVLNHHDVMKHFPVSMGNPLDTANFPGDARPQPAVGWIVNILPQMEEQALYDRFRAGGAFDGTFVANLCRAPRPDSGLTSLENGISVPELMKTQLNMLQCPSDSSVKQLTDKQQQWLGCLVAMTDYKGIIDDTWINLEFSVF